MGREMTWHVGVINDQHREPRAILRDFLKKSRFLRDRDFSRDRDRDRAKNRAIVRGLSSTIMNILLLCHNSTPVGP